MGLRSSETSCPAQCAGIARENRIGRRQVASRRCRLPPTELRTHRVRPPRERVGFLMAHPEAAARRDGREGSTETTARISVRAPHRRWRQFPRGSRNQMTRRALGRGGSRKKRRWARRSEAFGLMFLRAWDRVAAIPICSPSRKARQTVTDVWMRELKPHEWQRPSRSRSGRGVNRRGGEKPRGRNVPGEASPGEADPVAHVVVGAPNSTRGIQRLRPEDRR